FTIPQRINGPSLRRCQRRAITWEPLSCEAASMLSADGPATCPSMKCLTRQPIPGLRNHRCRPLVPVMQSAPIDRGSLRSVEKGIPERLQVYFPRSKCITSILKNGPVSSRWLYRATVSVLARLVMQCLSQAGLYLKGTEQQDRAIFLTFAK